MHAFLTAKVASVDPAFLSSIQQAWICAEAATDRDAGECDDDDDTGSVLQITIVEP